VVCATEGLQGLYLLRYNLDGVTINQFVDPGGALTGSTHVFEVADDYHFQCRLPLHPQVMAYASIGTGYKAGGRGSASVQCLAGARFGPEKLTSYELGLKTGPVR